MSDEIRAEITNAAKALCHYPSGPSSVCSCCQGIPRCEMGAAIAEIARLRAACDAYFKTISLSQMRHGRILVGLERRNARQRRALAKLYKRRHEKNVALATARRDALAEIKQDTDELIEQGRQDGMEYAAKKADAIARGFRVELPEKWKARPGGIPKDWMDTWEACAETAEEIAAAIREGGEAVSDIQALAAEYLKRAEYIGGCGDGGCVVFIRGGMHTNGGCRCARTINADGSREMGIHHLLSVAQRLARAVIEKDRQP